MAMCNFAALIDGRQGVLVAELLQPEDDQDRFVVQTLRELISGEVSPMIAAQRIDGLVTKDCAGSGNVGGWVHHLWNHIGRAAMVTASDGGQDRLVELVRELQRLPRHIITQRVYGGETHDHELWSLTPANGYDGFAQWMWDLCEGTLHSPWQSDGKTLAYQSFSGFLARLLAKGLVEATRLSALVAPSYFAAKYATDRSVVPQHYEPFVYAAAQWILHAGDALFEMCEKRTLVDLPGRKWTPNVWAAWRVRFKAVVATDREFSGDCRLLAQEVLDRMRQIEEAGVTSRIVDAFGFMSLHEGEDNSGGHRWKLKLSVPDSASNDISVHGL